MKTSTLVIYITSHVQMENTVYEIAPSTVASETNKQKQTVHYLRINLIKAKLDFHTENHENNFWETLQIK